MYIEVAALKSAARRLRLSGQLDSSAYAGIIGQLRAVRDQLATFERRVGDDKTDPVNFTALVRDTAGEAATDPGIQGVANSPADDDLLVAGPMEDLHDLLICLFEFARGTGPGALNLQMGAERRSGRLHDVCKLQLRLQASEVPEFLRRSLWAAAHRRRGEVSVTAELSGCRVALALPIERRLPCSR